MRPRRTPTTTVVFSLEGGNEDSDLWVRPVVETDRMGLADRYLESVWSLEPVERQAIADGANVLLRVWGAGMPPVAIEVTDEQPGR